MFQRNDSLVLKEFRCEQCDFQTNFKNSLKTHINMKHNQFKEFECNDCSYAVNKKSQLENHIKSVHQKIKDLFCLQCDFTTSLKSSLINHTKNILMTDGKLGKKLTYENLLNHLCLKGMIFWS